MKKIILIGFLYGTLIMGLCSLIGYILGRRYITKDSYSTIEVISPFFNSYLKEIELIDDQMCTLLKLDASQCNKQDLGFNELQQIINIHTEILGDTYNERKSYFYNKKTLISLLKNFQIKNFEKNGVNKINYLTYLYIEQLENGNNIKTFNEKLVEVNFYQIIKTN